VDRDEIVKQLFSQRSELIGYAWGIVRDDHLADDLFQEVCLIALRKADEIMDNQHLRGWLRQSLRYEALKAIRKDRNSPVVLGEQVLIAMDSAWDAEMVAAQQERNEHLADCMQKLTPNARRLVRLRYHEGISGRELADRVGRSVNAVYVGLTRAHRALEACIRRKEHEALDG
jgi:RNA polymerase sigma-70 factor (ECF subfamily)